MTKSKEFITIDYLKELKKFNVTYIELSDSNFTQKNKSCIFHEELKELILKQEINIEKKYFLNKKNEKNCFSQIVFSNKNNTIIYKPQQKALYIFDNNFELILEFHSDYSIYDSKYISGPYWFSTEPVLDKLTFVFSTADDNLFHLKPHDHHKNQIYCKSSSEINKVCLFIFKEDHIQVNFHLSVIKNVIFNLDGSINCINILNRVSEKTYLGASAYHDIIKEFENNIEFKELCEKTSFTMMSEEIFNKNLEFIFNVINVNQNLDITKTHSETNHIINNIINHFEKLQIMDSILKFEEIDYTKLLEKTFYKNYLLIKDKKSIESKTLLFLALMEVKDLNINNILNPTVLQEIQVVNNTVEKTVKLIIQTKLDKSLSAIRLKKKKNINNILTEQAHNEIYNINKTPKIIEKIGLDKSLTIQKLKKKKK